MNFTSHLKKKKRKKKNCNQKSNFNFKNLSPTLDALFIGHLPKGFKQDGRKITGSGSTNLEIDVLNI